MQRRRREDEDEDGEQGEAERRAERPRGLYLAAIRPGIHVASGFIYHFLRGRLLHILWDAFERAVDARRLNRPSIVP